MIWLLLALGCAGASPGPATSAPASVAPATVASAQKVETMRIKGPSDFSAATARYFELLYGGGPETTLDLALAPGTYEGSSLSLTAGPGAGRVSLRVHADGAVVFRGIRLELSGPTVQVEGIRFEGARPDGYALSVAGEHVRLSKLAFVDQALGSAGGGSRRARGVLDVGARGDAAILQVNDTWLVAPPHGTLVFLEAQPGHRFARATFEHSALVGGTPAVASMVLGTLRFDHCLVIGDEGAPPIAPIAKGRVQIADSVVVADSVDAISVPSVTGSTQAMEFTRVAVTGSTVYVRGPEGDRDPGTDLEGAVAGPPPAIDRAALAASARRGDAVPSTLR